MQRLVRAAMAAVIAAELLGEVRHRWHKVTWASHTWAEAFERREAKRQHQQAIVLLMTRMPGKRRGRSGG
jgi:hypothetical protein